MATQKKAASTEAEVTTTEEIEYVDVNFRDSTYQVPKDAEEWDVEVMEAFADGNITTALRALLGEAQWKSLKSEYKLKVKDLVEVADALMEPFGVDLGKSS